MFGKRVVLFELLGFKVQADASWLLLALLVTWSPLLGAKETGPGNTSLVGRSVITIRWPYL